MKHILLALAFVLTSFAAFAQQEDTATNYLQALFVIEDYDKMIAYGNQAAVDDLSSMALYYIGLAHFSKSNDSMATVFLKRSIEAYPHFQDPYYYMGLIHFFNDSLEQAEIYLTAALKVKAEDARTHLALAELYSEAGLSEQVLEHLKLAIKHDPEAVAPYIWLGELQLEQGNREEAYNLYYECLYKGDPADAAYSDCLYNVAVMDFDRKNWDESALALTTLLDRNPDDFQAIEKLMQVYFSQNRLDKIAPLRRQLYEAYMNNELPEHMSKQFLFDVWENNNLTFYAYENFAEPQDSRFNKHVFQVFDQADSLVATVMTEQSPTIRAAGTAFYLVKLDKAGKHIYGSETFDSSINYNRLKTSVERAAIGRLKATQVIEP